MICFTGVDQEMDDRIKIVLNDTLFLIKKEALKKALKDDKCNDKFDDDYFSSLRKGDESCDAEYC